MNIFKIILKVEKEIFFTFGVELPLLKQHWKNMAKHIQWKLDLEHSTLFRKSELG